MEETSSPPLSRQKFNFFNFLPKAMSSDPTPRTPKKKMMTMTTMMKNEKKKTSGATVILRRASMRINNNGSFMFKEPRSPKVSCIGNVANSSRNKNRKKKRKDDSEGKEESNTAAISPPNSPLILKLFLVFKKKGTKLANPYAESSSQPSAVSKRSSVPKLVQQKKYSGRLGGLSCFDWRVRDSLAVAPDRPSSLQNKRENRKDVIVVENMELVPRKEINLWKKRMVPPPPPLLV